jgi:hypothetical protein
MKEKDWIPVKDELPKPGSKHAREFCECPA